MKEYKFTGITSECDSLNHIKLTREVEKRINNDPYYAEEAKKVNFEYFQKLKEIASNPENSENAGLLVEKLNNSTGRFRYIKNEYDAEVEMDMLNWRFTLI